MIPIQIQMIMTTVTIMTAQFAHNASIPGLMEGNVIP